MLSKPLKWHGGKAYLSSLLIKLSPPADSYTHYVETHAGSAALLFARDPEGYSETINDIDYEVANFYRVLSDSKMQQNFLWRIACVPFGNTSFTVAQALQDFAEENPVDRAVAFFVINRQSRQGLMKDPATPTKRTRRGMNENVSAWLRAVDGMSDFFERLRRVEVCNKDAVELIKERDHPQCLFYLDPPYLHSTRVTTTDYKHEMSWTQHQQLLIALTKVEGKFMLSGYRNDLYDAYGATNKWNCWEQPIDNKASSKAKKDKKVECIWRNYWP